MNMHGKLLRLWSKLQLRLQGPPWLPMSPQRWLCAASSTASPPWMLWNILTASMWVQKRRRSGSWSKSSLRELTPRLKRGSSSPSKYCPIFFHIFVTILEAPTAEAHFLLMTGREMLPSSTAARCSTVGAGGGAACTGQARALRVSAVLGRGAWGEIRKNSSVFLHSDITSSSPSHPSL